MPTPPKVLPRQVPLVLPGVSPPTPGGSVVGPPVTLPLPTCGSAVIVVQCPLTFSRGGTILTPIAPINIVIWQAPFNCTVTNVRGYAVGATGTVINAQKNSSLTHLAANLTLSSTGTWLDGGAVQNTTYVSGDEMEMMLVSIGGSPSQIAVEIILTRP
jgi:hypothetical protein